MKPLLLPKDLGATVGIDEQTTFYRRASLLRKQFKHFNLVSTKRRADGRRGREHQQTGGQS